MRRWLGAALGACIAVATVPRWTAGQPHAWYDGEPAVQLALARGVAARVRALPAPEAYQTGSARFDGEWRYATAVFAAIGLGQVALQHPEHAAELIPAMEEAIAGASTPAARAFETAAWGEDGVGAEEGRAALGYLGVATALHARLVPPPEPDPLGVQLAGALAAAPAGLVETYPGEAYPADTCMVAAAVRLHGHEDAYAAWRPHLAGWVDPDSGLLYQAMTPAGRPRDRARGSGTALCAWALSLVDPDLGQPLYDALIAQGRGDWLGFGALREVPRGGRGVADIDSGPVIAGYGVSVSGMGLGAARAYGDRATFARLYRTAHLFGAPRGDGAGFVTGGPLGDALMLAFLTTPAAR